MRPSPLAVCCALLFVLARPAAAQEALRVRFGTNSLGAAQTLSKCLDHPQARKHNEALAAAQDAIKLDPKCQIAYFFRAFSQGELGQIDEAIDGYKICLSDDVSRSRKISALSAGNLALTLMKLDRHEEAQLYFSRAIME